MGYTSSSHVCVRWWRSGEQLATWPIPSGQLTLLLTNPVWPNHPVPDQSAPDHPLLFKGWKGTWLPSLCCQVSPLAWCLYLLLVPSGPAFSCMMEQEACLGDASSNVKGQILIWFISAVIEVAWAPHGFQLWAINNLEMAYLWEQPYGGYEWVKTASWRYKTWCK